MAKATKLPPFADWKRPWKDDEFDAEKAAKLIYNLHKDKQALSETIDTKDEEIETLTDERDELTTKVEGLEEKGLNEVDRLKLQVERLTNAKEKPAKEKKVEKTDDSDTSLNEARLEIALDMGLTKAQAKRLVGSTREELEADAEAYMEEHGLTAPGAGDDDGKQTSTKRTTGKEGQAPPSQRTKPKVRTGTGGDTDVDPDGDLDPGALWDKVHGNS